MAVRCPECGTEFQNERGLAVHKGHAHGPHTETCVRCENDFRIPPNKADKVEQCSDCRNQHGHTERRNRKIKETKAKMDTSHSEEAKKNMSKSHQGKTLSEEHRRNIGRANEGEKNSMYGKTGRDHPGFGNQGFAEIDTVEVEETGHVVKSRWEAEIDRLLHSEGVAYEYEGVTFDLGRMTYTPDFVLEGVIVEVKGLVWPQDVERAKRFMEEEPERTYIVVGNRESPKVVEPVPCHIHLPWGEHEKLPGVL